MANVSVIGAQWGDEGKGKIVDWLASRADIVVRFQGGHNAGHTLVVGNEIYRLSLLPSGVVRGKIGIIGNGVVIDPEALLAEIEKVKTQGIEVKPANLRVAENATLILPMHPAIDRAREAAGGALARPTRTRSPAVQSGSLIWPSRRPCRTSWMNCCCITIPCCKASVLKHSPRTQCSRGCLIWHRASCRSPNRPGCGWTRPGGRGGAFCSRGRRP
jgi:hypothetical protein